MDMLGSTEGIRLVCQRLPTEAFDVEGTTIVVFTDGPALLFHGTADGWKLFTKSTGDYFHQRWRVVRSPSREAPSAIPNPCEL